MRSNHIFIDMYVPPDMRLSKESRAPRLRRPDATVYGGGRGERSETVAHYGFRRSALGASRENLRSPPTPLGARGHEGSAAGPTKLDRMLSKGHLCLEKTWSAAGLDLPS